MSCHMVTEGLPPSQPLVPTSRIFQTGICSRVSLRPRSAMHRRMTRAQEVINPTTRVSSQSALPLSLFLSSTLLSSLLSLHILSRLQLYLSLSHSLHLCFLSSIPLPPSFICHSLSFLSSHLILFLPIRSYLLVHRLILSLVSTSPYLILP